MSGVEGGGGDAPPLGQHHQHVAVAAPLLRPRARDHGGGRLLAGSLAIRGQGVTNNFSYIHINLSVLAKTDLDNNVYI